MTINVPCPNCGTLYTIRRDLIGKRTKCTRCGAPFSIAEPPAAPAPPIPQRPAPVQPPAKPAFQPPPQQPLETAFPDFPAFVPQPTRSNTATKVREVPAPLRPSLLREFFAFDIAQGQRTFRILRFLAKSFAISGVLALASSAYWAIYLLIAIIRDPTSFAFTLTFYGSNFYGSIASAASLFIATQLIRLGLQLEQNTRESSEANRRVADHLTAIEIER